MKALGSLKSVFAAPADDYGSTMPWIRYGNRVLAGLAVGSLLAGFITISGAVVATGVVNVETNNKTVQHLDGGIVSKILVRNGDRVAAGDIVLRLDDTQVKASFGVTAAKVNDFLVQQARLEAERDRVPEMVLPPSVLATQSEPGPAKIIASQQSLFRARMSAHRGELDVLRQRIEQVTNDSQGLEKTLAAKQKEAAISKAELASLKPLFDRGFANQQRYLPVQRDNARLEGDVGRLTSDFAKVRSAVAEAQLRLAQNDKDYTQTVVDELRKVQAGLAEAMEQRTAIEDKLKRIEIRAPRTGFVHALAAHTEGGVIAAGSPIMQIVPEGEKLLVDAQLTPQDIDKVRRGQAAYIRFPAFNAKSTPRLEATVLNVSAAQITETQGPTAGKSYFSAQIALNAGELAKLPKGHALVPGMPAEVYIETETRSILSYLVKPLVDSMSRVFRET